MDGALSNNEKFPFLYNKKKSETRAKIKIHR